MTEIDILKTTEAEKTRLRMEAEKDRLKKILELNTRRGISAFCNPDPIPQEHDSGD